MQKAEYKKQCEDIANSEREAGGSVKINRDIPYVVVKRSDGNEYFFPDDSAEKLLASVPDDIDAKDYILYQATNW